MRKTIIILVVIALVATTVSCDNRDAGFDDYFSQDDEIAKNTSPSSAKNNENTEPERGLEDTLTIWAQQYFDSELRVYAKMFQDANPDISIKVETYELSHGDSSKQLALSESAEDFFNGMTTASEAARVVQSRVTVYISEHS